MADGTVSRHEVVITLHVVFLSHSLVFTRQTSFLIRSLQKNVFTAWPSFNVSEACERAEDDGNTQAEGD